MNFGCCCLVTKSCPTLCNWQRLPFPSAVDLPDPDIKPASPALAGGFFTTEPSGKPLIHEYGGLMLSTSWASEEEKRETLGSISQGKVDVGEQFLPEIVPGTCEFRYRIAVRFRQGPPRVQPPGLTRRLLLDTFPQFPHPLASETQPYSESLSFKRNKFGGNGTS